MPTGLIHHPIFHDHDTGPGHPERAARLTAITERLKRDGLWDRLTPMEFEPAVPEEVHRLHDAGYIAAVQRACERGQPYIDTPDSAISEKSYDAALHAVGGALAASAAVMRGDLRNAFCLSRPPGHHAERDRSMGFCLFNHAALAAEMLTRAHRLERVAIVDFDVHHGNGTQHLLEHRADVMYLSVHQHPDTLYPGTGYAEERGVGDGLHFTVNLPLLPGAGDAEYLDMFDESLLPALRAYRPQFLILSAGFDAAADDPLAAMQVTGEGFHEMTRRLLDAADELCGGRVVSILEGGYDLRALADAAADHVAQLLDRSGG